MVQDPQDLQQHSSNDEQHNSDDSPEQLQVLKSTAQQCFPFSHPNRRKQYHSINSEKQ
jgi:hypothetical protein